MGILAAVIERTQTGEGQAIDISMTDTAFALNAMAGAGYLGGGVIPELDSLPLSGGGFYGYYETCDGRWMSVGSLEPQFMQRLCGALACPELAVDGLTDDREAQESLRAVLKEKFATMSFAQCRALFDTLDACVEPVLNIDEAARHPLFEARDMIARVPAADGDSQRQLAAPIKFSRHVTNYRHTGVDAGAHNEEVLHALNKSDAEIAQLYRDGVLGKLPNS